MRKITSLLTPAATVPLLILTGCTGISSVTGSDTLAVRSIPPDATVFIFDRAVGQTPLELTQQSLYPSTYPRDKEDMYGVVTVKKAGCRDYTKRINNRDIAQGINAELDCGKTQAPADAASADLAPIEKPNPETPQKPATHSAKQRLQRIDRLKDEGLITEQEYQAIRQRILDSL